MEIRRVVRDALALLDKDDFVLGIQDVSFPQEDDEDIGRGSPYSRGGTKFLEFAGSLGFTGIQLGPQGITHRGSASPYEGTIFSRNPLNLPLRHLVDRRLLWRETLQGLVEQRPHGALERSPYSFVFEAYEHVKREVFEAWTALREPSEEQLAEFQRRNERWLFRDALYDALCAEHANSWWRAWAGPNADKDRRLFAPQGDEDKWARARIEELKRRHATIFRRHLLLQFLIDEEHRAFRSRTRELDLKVFGDLQIGYSAQDEWAWQHLFLRDYRMGAPPSRTNPDGQPWNYAVLDPRAYGSRRTPGPAIDFVRARADRLFDEFEGIRVDHPHGWVCPWVYAAADSDELRAVQNGARLFSSPDVAEHESLAHFAIARPDQLRRDVPRYDDDWVQSLDADQVERYALLPDVLVESAQASGLDRASLPCEVLSTLPYPVHRVLQRHGLGRFRITQKANIDDPSDVYRSENARPEDWIMLGNHDTPPIWAVVERWTARGEIERRCQYVATRLTSRTPDREALAQQLASNPGRLVQALLADILASNARHVHVFFTDLFGLRESFNDPGTVKETNWTLRAPHDFEDTYRRRVSAREALDLPAALSLALKARGGEHRLALARALARRE